MAIQRLFYWGAYADKYGGTVQVRGRGRGCGHTEAVLLGSLCRQVWWHCAGEGEGQGVWPYRGCFVGELMQTSMVALCR